MLIKFSQGEVYEKIKRIDKKTNEEEERREETRGFPGRVYLIG